MKLALVNLPWEIEGNEMLWGVRAGSRWPHLQRRAAAEALPRYVPFPFFLSIAASVSRLAGHDTLLLDAIAENIRFKECSARLLDFAPDILFAEVSTPSLAEDFRMLRALRKAMPGTTLVCGGSHSPELAAEAMRREAMPDFWIAGEYELALAELASSLENGLDGSDIKGVIKAGSDFKGFASAGNLDALPSPLWDSLPVQSYSDPVCGLPAPNAQSWLSRGCPFKCSFCVWPQIVYGESRCRPRDIDIALDEVSTLISEYGCESYYFDDDTANIGERRMAELAEGIKKRKLDIWPWAMMARADCMTPSMLENLASAGMYAVKYGVESFSPKLIDACGKGTRLERMREAIEKTRSLKIKMHLTFTFGLPGETRETVMETVEEAIRVAPESAQFSICTPFPGTRFHEECRANGWLDTDDWSRFLGNGEEVVVSTPTLAAKELKAAYSDAMVKWRKFLEERTERRKRRLVDAIKSSGAKWHLSGDTDFAAFLKDAGLQPDAATAEEAGLLVVVSRHDEERIARRLRRNFAEKRIESLFRDE
jgi:anaerobic magnesium-protoporphyrin IX monomethyl ester cyclase